MKCLLSVLLCVLCGFLQAAEKPNIVVILVDDMGFADLGCYGSEIPTPNLDALAKNGLRFTQFYNTGRCCPTRATLLTGLYSHQAGVGHMTDDKGVPVTRWDGKAYKKHPVTGEDVPDDKAQIPQERYVNPRKAAWPEADFVVGNPPYLGARTIRAALGDGYLHAVRSAYGDLPEHVDYVMYW